MFEANFPEGNFNFSHEKKLTVFSVVTQEEVKKNETKQKLNKRLI